MPSAQRVRWAKFRVTCVSVVALIILGVLAYLLTGGTLLEPKTKLFLYIPDATGLGPQSPVRVDGIDIGTVDSVKFSGSNDPLRIIRVEITIQKSRLSSITEDSAAQISNDTIVGDKFVDITTGRAPGHVPENGELRFKAQSDLMRSVDLVQIEQQLRIVDATLADIEEGRSELGKFVLGDQVYASMRRRLTQLQSTIQRAMANNAVLGSLAYTDTLYQKILAPLSNLDRQIATIQSGQGSLGQFLHDPAQFEQFRATLTDLRQSIANIRSAGFINSDEDYAGWIKSITSITRQAEEVNESPLLNSTDLYDAWNGAFREMQRSLKDFRENPRKYLRLKMF
jgi:phospholipid/cholesterol/gamma-HCH transport system substrate-binding protein